MIDQLPRKGEENYVSRPTVYRTLKEFVDAGLLRRFELNGRSVYEHDYGYPEHDHFYCIKCHQLLECQSEQLAQLREEIGEAAFQSWIKPMKIRAVTDGVVHVTVPTRFMRDWVVAHYAERIATLWQAEAPEVASLGMRD